jgi:hypothetical protein
MGAQTCADDGQRWLECICGASPNSDAGPSADAGGGTGGHGGGGTQGGGGKPQPDFDASHGGAGGEPVGPVPAVGNFVLRLIPPVPAAGGVPAVDGVTTLVGRVNDGPTPELIRWTSTRNDATCRVLEPSIPFCDPSCAGGRVCVDEDTCQAYPTAHTVGNVHLDGVRNRAGATAFDVLPVGNTYQYTDCPFPAFDEGGAIRLDAAGGDLDPFTIAARGVAPLEVPAAEFAMVRGEPLVLTWVAPGLADVSTVHVKVDISHHGGSRGKIECDAPDTGRLEIPAELSDHLLDLGAVQRMRRRQHDRLDGGILEHLGQGGREAEPVALGDLLLRDGIARDGVDEANTVADPVHGLDERDAPPAQPDDADVDHVRPPPVPNPDRLKNTRRRGRGNAHPGAQRSRGTSFRFDRPCAGKKVPPLRAFGASVGTTEISTPPDTAPAAPCRRAHRRCSRPPARRRAPATGGSSRRHGA